MNKRFLMLLAGLVLLAGLAEAQNLLRNPGFETPEGAAGVALWIKPNYWGGEMASVLDATRAKGGKRLVRLTAQAAQGRHWSRMHSIPAPVTFGLNYRLSVWAQGTGAVKLGIIGYWKDAEGKQQYESRWQPQGLPLTGQWQLAAYDFPIPRAEVETVAVMIEIEGEGAVAEVDEATLEVTRQAEGLLTCTPTYVMAPAGEKVTLSLKTLRQGQPLAGGEVSVTGHDGTARVATTLRLGEGGSAAHEVSTPAPAGQLLKFNFVQADLGAAVTCYLDVVTPEVYQAFATAAAATKVKAPGHVLFLGDSLTDFLRGYNYVDQVGFWLQKVHGPQVTVKNAGVGGDYITRVWQRLSGAAGVHRPEMYHNLLQPQPDRIFIFLGHNDSKLSSGSEFTKPTVLPDDYRADYRKVIEKLRAASQAQITLLSPTSSVYEITRPMAERLLAQRGSASLFGKPEVMAQFTALTRQVAEELQCGLVDVYEPTFKHPDKPSLFTQDGVHMTLAGNHVVALELLKYLGK